MYYLLGVAVLLGGVAFYVSTLPAAFRIARSLVIDAPPSTLFGLINNLREWEKWSPWDKIDPNLKRTYEGPESGVGAVYRWQGNSKVGEGSMTLLTSAEPSKIEIELKFIKPFAATNKAIFTLVPADGGTAVTWAMEGERNFAAKAMTLFMNMDEMVGRDFVKGLAALKEVATTQR